MFGVVKAYYETDWLQIYTQPVGFANSSGMILPLVA
jgi:hypothetical protein